MFITGYSVIAIEHALMKNGSIVRLVCTFFISLRRAINFVASISSEKVKAGIDRASVMVFVMAFFMPVIFLTVSCSVIPSRGAILGPPLTTVIVSPELGGVAAWDAVPCPLLIKLRRSPLVTRPFLPVPCTLLMSTPSFLARCLTAGVDKALESSPTVCC